MFPLLPPEINSLQMYAGAGSGPLFSAGSAWNALSSELSSAAVSFHSVIADLSATWNGATSLAMAAVAAPYVAVLHAAAGHALNISSQSFASGTAFETARAATVHPAAVTENRTQLLSLVATNFLGQNTPAIMMTEFHYMEMWAADVAALFGYHAHATATAASVVPFSLSGLESAVGSELASTGLLAPVTGAISMVTSNPELLSVGEMGMYPISMMMSPIMMLARMGGMGGMGGGAMSGAAGMAAASAPKFVGDVTPKGMGGMGGMGLRGIGPISSGLGKSHLVGAMSVPQSWQGSSPVKLASASMSGLSSASATSPVPTGSGGGMPMMPMPMGGSQSGAMGSMMARGGASSNGVVQARPSVIPRVGVG